MSEETKFPLDESLVVQDDKGTVVLQVALLATHYFAGGYRPAARLAVIECWEEYNALCEGQLGWAIDPEKKTWRDLERNPLPEPREWLTRLDADEAWHLTYHGGDHFNSASPFLFNAFGRPDWENAAGMSCVQAGLPLTWFADHDGNLIDLAARWADRLHSDSGYSGIGLIESQNRTTALDFQRSVYQFAQRFPGLEIDDPVSHSRFVNDGIKGVNWLTLVGDRWLKQLGGATQLQSGLSADFIFRAYDGGILIQAGQKPQLGDMRLGRKPDRYVQLNAILRPIRIAKHRKFHEGSGQDILNADNTLRWLGRLD